MNYVDVQHNNEYSVVYWPGPDPEYDPLRDWECRTPFQLITRLLDGMFAGPAPGYAADLIEAIERHRPDLVVCSMLGGFGAMVGAEAAGVPTTC
jgi:hypothetical protein